MSAPTSVKAFAAVAVLAAAALAVALPANVYGDPPPPESEYVASIVE